MLSKNNRQEQFRKQESKKQRFAIKKLTVGVASVLIGFTFMGLNTQASADDTPTQPANSSDNAQSEVNTSTALQSAATITLNNDGSQNNDALQSANSASVTKPDSDTAVSKESQQVIEDNANTKTIAQTSTSAPVGSNSSLTSSNAVAYNNVNELLTNLSTDLSGTAESNAPVTGSAAKDDNVITSNGNGVVTGKNAQGTWAAMDTATAEAPEAPTYKNPMNVTNWASFINALEDANVDNINITHDITVTGKTGSLGGQSLGYNGCLTFTKQNVARKVTITGNGNTIDFGHYSLMFQDANQKNGNGWDITIDNTKLKGVSQDGSGKTSTTKPGQFGLISFANVNSDNQKNDSVTLNNVTASASGRAVVNGSETDHSGVYYKLNLTGNNNITASEEEETSTLTGGISGSALDAGYVAIENGTTTINVTSAYDGNNNFGGNAIRTAQTDIHNDDGSTIYTFDVKKGATLNITGGKDVRGIYAVDGTHGTANIDGIVNMNLGTGHSMAVFAGNLNVGKDGVLDVTAATDATPNWGQVARSISNFNGGQYGVLSIGVGQPTNLTNVDSNTINDNGIIRVKRTSTNEGMNPIISMGSGSSAVLKGTFTINVNQGATLDLQDSRQQTNLGMIFVSGSSANSNINIVNPKYVNLQRLNNPLPSNGSDLIYLEGGGQSGRTNGVHISNAPIAEWQAANTSTAPNFTWMVQSVNSMNNWGTNAGSGFTVAGQTEAQNKDGQEKFLYSNGNVIMAPSQSGTNSFEYNGSQTVNKNSNQGIIVQGAGSVNYYTPYLNQFLNNYSYWTPQRLAMGSSLLTPDSPVPVKDNDLYDPEVQTINGNTRETLNDLDPKDGIKDLLKAEMDENGNWTKTTVPVDGNVQSVAWYTPADATEWSNIMGGENTPTNPEGNLKTTDTSAWAKVTYNDGSIDFVKIPLNITDKTNADIYTPSYQDASVKQGESVTTEAPTYTTDDGKAATAPAGTSYKIDGSFQAPAGATVTIDSTTGKITVNAGANTPVGEIDVPVTVTYPGDNSTDNVTAKITVTASDANTYTPSYQDIKGLNDHDITTTPIIRDSEGNIVTPTDGNPTYSFTNPNDVPSTIAIDDATGKITVKAGTDAGEYNIPVTVTYHDGSTDDTSAKITVDGVPEVQPITVNEGKVPEATDGISNYNPNGKAGYPSKVTWETTPDTTTPGTKGYTVNVDYPDGTTTTAIVPVSVTGTTQDGDDSTYYGTMTRTTFTVDPINTHKTTNVPVNLDPGKFNKIVVESDWNKDTGNYDKTVTYILSDDGTTYVNEADPSDTFAANEISYTWQDGFKPNTNVDQFNGNTGDTLADDPFEKTTTGNLAGNSKYRVNTTVSGDAATKLLVSPGSTTWHNQYINFYGATANDGLTAIHNDGNSIPHAEKGVNESQLTSAHNVKVSSTVWQTKPDVSKIGNTTGTVRINFNDSTYLDVEVPVKVVGNDADIYTARYYDTYYVVDVNGKITGDLAQPIHFYKAGNLMMILPTDEVPTGSSYTKYTGSIGGSRTLGWEYANLDESTGQINFIKDQLANAKNGVYYLPVIVNFNDGSSLKVLEKLNVQINAKQDLVDTHELKITGSYKGPLPSQNQKLDNQNLTLKVTANDGNGHKIDQTWSGDQLKDVTATVVADDKVKVDFGNFGIEHGYFGVDYTANDITITDNSTDSNRPTASNRMMLFSFLLTIDPHDNIAVKDLDASTNTEDTTSSPVSNDQNNSSVGTPLTEPELPTYTGDDQETNGAALTQDALPTYTGAVSGTPLTEPELPTYTVDERETNGAALTQDALPTYTGAVSGTPLTEPELPTYTGDDQETNGAALTQDALPTYTGAVSGTPLTEPELPTYTGNDQETNGAALTQDALPTYTGAVSGTPLTEPELPTYTGNERETNGAALTQDALPTYTGAVSGTPLTEPELPTYTGNDQETNGAALTQDALPTYTGAVSGTPETQPTLPASQDDSTISETTNTQSQATQPQLVEPQPTTAAKVANDDISVTTVASVPTEKSAQLVAKKLPQTGNNNNRSLSVAGLALSGLISMFGLARITKKK
ncbi:YPDG domain-containing protein [Limosilactobacillus agrestis]|uniref:Rib/alpha-like domain-containing protein n=1 Tax=Limosilactobacillus agrestis TaxID=2759748 RepID=UPI001E489CA1|nr:Rib/alpha-like domain-containing protein [Limosilactobacillus agrestis]MCD7119830.1 YPDG domain-containing protein [Limosilactobacillus agrestis]